VALLVQTVAGAGQFDGTAGAGLFVWPIAALNRTTRVRIHWISIHIDGDAAPVARIDVVFRNPSTAVPMLLGRGLAAAVVGPVPAVDGADFVLPCGIVPRLNTGEHFELQVFTVAKTVAGSVTVDYSLEPWPDTDPRSGA